MLLLDLSVLFALAFTLGRLAMRIGMPSVVGELLAGVLAGPTVLGHVWAATSSWLFQGSVAQLNLLDAVGQVGVLLLVGVTGMHLDTAVLRRQKATVLRVGAGAFVIPLVLGIAAGYALPEAVAANSAGRRAFALFLAVAMCVSAIPVIAKTLMDMNLIHRNTGQMILAAGMVDDAAGWIMLSVISAMVTVGAKGNLVVSLVGLVALLAFSAFGARPLTRLAIRRAQRSNDTTHLVTGLAVLMIFGFAAISQALGLEAVFGAFLAGAVLASAGGTAAMLAPLRTVLLTVLAPIYFATAGLRIDLTALARPTVLVSAIAILLLAVVGKFTGAALGAWWSRMNRWEMLALGAGLNARGVIDVIVAMVGLRLGILNGATFTIIILVAIVTSVMAAPVLRYATNRLEQTEEERLRARVQGTDDDPAHSAADDASALSVGLP